MDRRKLRALQIVERIRSHELDVEAAKLGDMRAQMSALEAEKGSHEASLRRDGVMNGAVELAPYIGPFVRSMRAAIAGAEGKMVKLRDALNSQEEVVREKFTDKKTVELVAESEAEAISRSEKRRAAASQDDLTIMRRRAYDRAGRL